MGTLIAFLQLLLVASSAASPVWPWEPRDSHDKVQRNQPKWPRQAAQNATTLIPSTTPADALVPTAVTALPSPASASAVSPQVFAANLVRARRYNSLFATLTAASACTGNQAACVGGGAAQGTCGPNGTFSLAPCANGTRCFALPMFTADMVELSCLDPDTAEQILGSAATSAPPASSLSSPASSTLSTTSSPLPPFPATNTSASTTAGIPPYTITATLPGSSGSITVTVTHNPSAASTSASTAPSSAVSSTSASPGTPLASSLQPASPPALSTSASPSTTPTMASSISSSSSSSSSISSASVGSDPVKPSPAGGATPTSMRGTRTFPSPTDLTIVPVTLVPGTETPRPRP